MACSEKTRDAATCEREAVAQAQRCIADLTRPVEPKAPEQDPTAICRERVQSYIKGCTEKTGDAAACEKDGVAQAQRCVAGLTRPEPLPAPVDCKALGEKAYLGCIEGGQDVEVCKKGAIARAEDCAARTRR